MLINFNPNHKKLNLVISLISNKKLKSKKAFIKSISVKEKLSWIKKYSKLSLILNLNSHMNNKSKVKQIIHLKNKNQLNQLKKDNYIRHFNRELFKSIILNKGILNNHLCILQPWVIYLNWANHLGNKYQNHLITQSMGNKKQVFLEVVWKDHLKKMVTARIILDMMIVLA